MPALTTSVDESTTRFPTDTANPSPGATYTIDDEAIVVHGSALSGLKGGDYTVWIVQRGFAGTTAATHSPGATLTRYYPDAASAGGGGEQMVRLLGPFTVNFDDSDLDPPQPGKFLSDEILDAGTLVYQAFFAITDDWVGSGDARVTISAGAPADWANTEVNVVTYKLRIAGTPQQASGSEPFTFNFVVNYNQNGQITDPQVTYLAVPSKLAVVVHDEVFAAVASSAGSVKVWVLILQPAG